MPTVTMSDSDWLIAYSTLMQSLWNAQHAFPLQSPQPASFSVTVSFAASEVFTAFNVEYPFEYPGSNTVIGPLTWSGSPDLSVTSLETDVSGFTVTGSNLSGGEIDITFSVGFVLAP
jgi:hypothetical protein